MFPFDDVIMDRSQYTGGKLYVENSQFVLELLWYGQLSNTKSIVKAHIGN